MRRAAAWVGLLGLVLLPGCSQPAVCTEIAAESGLSLTVERELAADLTDLTLTVCVDQTCTDHPVTLAAGFASTQASCGSASPDGTCQGIPVPDGTSVGFVRMPDLPDALVKVSAVAKLGSSTLTLQAVDVKVSQTFPNGSGCPPQGNQGSVRVGPRGLS